MDDSTSDRRTLRLARFKNLESDFLTTCEQQFDNIPGYIRTSEYVDVTFPPLSDTTVVSKHIEALDRAAEALTERYEERMSALKRQKAELAALTYQPDVVE